MSLAKYLKEGKIELLCQWLNHLLGLKIVSCWLMSESQLEKRVETGTTRRFAFVITVSISKEAIKLYSQGLRFEETFKIVKNYSKAR